jgi:predicted Zn-ribbon and HTH transcriptional regulator
MPLAIFGIDNTAISLAVTLVILALLAIWIALVVFTFLDARRRISDQFLVGCATAASLFPFVGTIVYTILRPAEFLEDVREREIEMKSAETELRHLEANSCHKCGFATQPDFIRCPACRSRLKEPCPSCDRPVGLRWKVCPYCEHTLIASKRSTRQSRGSEDPKSGPRNSAKAPAKTAAKAESRDRRSARRESQPRSASRSAEKPDPATKPRATKRPERPAPERPTKERRRVTISEDEDTQVSHQPINGGDSSPAAAETDRS